MDRLSTALGVDAQGKLAAERIKDDDLVNAARQLRPRDAPQLLKHAANAALPHGLAVRAITEPPSISLAPGARRQA